MVAHHLQAMRKKASSQGTCRVVAYWWWAGPGHSLYDIILYCNIIYGGGGTP